MAYRLLIALWSTVFLLAACSPVTVQPAPSGNTAVVPSATESPTSIAATITPTAEPANSLQIIRAENWSRLQLLQTFPAEMPLRNTAVSISQDGETLAVGSNGGAKIFFFDIPSGQILRTVTLGIPNPGDYFNIVGIEYLPDDTLIVNSTGPYQIYHIDDAGNVLAMWDGLSFALSADRKTLVHGGAEGVTLVDIAMDTPIASLPIQDALDHSLSPDGSTVAVNVVGVEYANVVIWDVASNTQLAEFKETGNPRYSPDNRFLAVTSYEADTPPLRIFTPQGDMELPALEVGDENLSGSAPLWSPDGSILTTVGPLIAWDTTNWQPLHAPALEGSIQAFSPDGRILITRALNGGLMLWGVLP